ncbi:hypothetical protein GTA08_BOTSDO08478 [Neofusicoccum parvum]|uniref:Uncharacterized protein n=1 Tax=Neofusicoccum parvum TaxID=310453 RepID=A0ACB5SB52_9PEZI|nr:hypothetical protein GTA08_BOTSDO08478 [Neofusicoccum parvum]
MPPYKLNKQDLPNPRLTLDPDGIADKSHGHYQAAPAMVSTSEPSNAPATASSIVNQPADQQEISPNRHSALGSSHAASAYTAYLNTAAAQWKHNYEDRSPEQKARDVEHKRQIDKIAVKQRKTAFGGNKIDFGPAKPKKTKEKPNTKLSQPSRASYIADVPDETLDDDLGDPELYWAIRESLAVGNAACDDTRAISRESTLPQQRGFTNINDGTRSKYLPEQESTQGNDDMDISMADSVASLIGDTSPAVWIYDSNAEHDHPSPFLRPFEKDMITVIGSHSSSSGIVGNNPITSLNPSLEETDNTVDHAQRTSDRQMTEGVSTPATAVRYITPEFKKPPPPRARARRIPWTDREKQACKLAMQWALIKCRQVKVEERWDHMSQYLAETFKVHRTGAAIKDQWNRYLREEYNMDERIRKKPDRMVTCAQPSKAGDKRKLQQLEQSPDDRASPSTNSQKTFPAAKVPKFGSQATPKAVTMDATPQASTASTNAQSKKAQDKRLSLTTPSALSRSATTNTPATSTDTPSPDPQRIRIQLLAAGQKVIDTFLTTTGKPIPSNVQDILQALVAAFAPKVSGHSHFVEAEPHAAPGGTPLSCVSGNGSRAGGKGSYKSVGGVLVDEDGLPVSAQRAAAKKGGVVRASLRDGYIGRGKSFLYE